LLDGAHNIAGVETLRAALPAGVPLVFIVGFLGDKDWRPMCEILAPLAAKIFCVPVASARTADARELSETFRAANPAAEVLVCGSLNEALGENGSRLRGEEAASAAQARGRSPHQTQELIVITGSLYLVGEALELLGLSPADAGERGLNEWSVKK
jgi:dihydrofolate synthase/folylpolyglutamate synthase